VFAQVSTVSDLYARPSDDQAKRDAVLKKLSPGANFAVNFSRLVLAPIMHLHQLVMRDAATPDVVNAALIKVGKKLDRSDFSILSNRDLLRATMRNFMPAATTLLQMIMTKLPSPQEAQRYRAKVLYPLPTSRSVESEDEEIEVTENHPSDDPVFNAIQACDPNGPCVMYVSKLVPIGKLLMALGRVFSGTVRPGMTVRVMAAENAHDPAAWTEARIQRVVQTEGHSISSLHEALAGAVCGLVGMDDCLTRSGTVTTSIHCRPLAAMNFSVSPVVRVAIRAENPSGASRLANGLQVLIKNDPCIQCYMDSETKEHIVAGTGELHLEVCINRLRELCSGIPLVVSSALVSLRETVSGESPVACMAKSANKHNRVWFTASALPLNVVEDMEIAATSSIDQKTATLRVLERNGWSKAQQRKVMVCGGAEIGPNILVDSTTGVQYLQEIRDHIISAFTKLCLEGPLCRERLRGVRIDLVDARVHSEGAQRRAPQVVPACARAMSAAILSAFPIVMEPMYCVEVQVPNNLVGVVHSVISRRRGTVESYSERAGDASIVHGFLPVSESNGFTADVRSQTHGKGFPNCRFDHWRAVGEDMGARVITESRLRKGMPEQVPTVESLIDKV
jgi:elongation factor 2